MKLVLKSPKMVNAINILNKTQKYEYFNLAREQGMASFKLNKACCWEVIRKKA